VKSAHVFIHQGKSWWLPYAVRTCVKSDPGTPTLLIGDRRMTSRAGFARLQDYQRGAEVTEFNRNYVHLSSNAPAYELFCFQRWFYLLAYMKQHHLEVAMHHDSDVMFFSTLERLRSLYPESFAYAGVCQVATPGGLRPVHISGHSSVWTQQALEDFCGYVLRAYTQKNLRDRLVERWEECVEKQVAGGISDMMLLTNFVEQSPREIGNLLEIREGCVIDHGVHVSHGVTASMYEMEGRTKKISKKGADYYFARRNGELVQALSIHFQGGHKRAIPLHYRGHFYFLKCWKDVKRLFSFPPLKAIEKRFRRWRKSWV
jgi:hypothetical protein